MKRCNSCIGLCQVLNILHCYLSYKKKFLGKTAVSVGKSVFIQVYSVVILFLQYVKRFRGEGLWEIRLQNRAEFDYIHIH